VAGPERFAVIAPLPALGGFRRSLAVEGERDRAVVLAFAPPELAGDPAASAALVARAQAASALRHPGAAAVLGAETIAGALAVIEEHRPGTPLRALLDAAGRLPADVAARAILDAAEGLARAHAVDAGGGARLAHPALDPSALVISDDGPAFVSGLGLGTASDLAADVRALGAALHECLAGEPAGAPPRKLDVPGLPAALVAAVDRATGADGPPLPTVAALAEAVAAAIAPASHGAVAAYADAVLPPDAGERARLRRVLSAALGGDILEVSAELLEAGPPAGPGAGSAPGGGEASGGGRATQTLESARVFAAPSRRPASSRLPVVVGVIALAAGFAAGFFAQRASRPPPPPAAAPSRPAPGGAGPARAP
jgi:hypothetical protein